MRVSQIQAHCLPHNTDTFRSQSKSFLYLKTFYVGEVWASDLALVPKPVNKTTGVPDPAASAEFLSQLREHTQGFRVANDTLTPEDEGETKERAPRVHLGARR